MTGRNRLDNGKTKPSAAVRHAGIASVVKRLAKLPPDWSATLRVDRIRLRF